VIHFRPRDAAGYLGLGKSLTGGGDHDAAIRVCGRGIKIAPRRADLYELRGSCYRALDAPSLALVDYDACLTRDPENLVALRWRASLHGYADDRDRQLEDLSRIIALKPDDSTALHGRGLLYEGMGKHELAIEDFTRALAANTKSPAAFLLPRGRAHLALGALEAAQEDFSRVIALEGWGEANGLWLRGHVHRRRGDVESAGADYYNALALDETLGRNLRRRGTGAARLEAVDILLALRAPRSVRETSSCSTSAPRCTPRRATT
jgi:tetratricopeptide (TPR) repeat protein